LRLKNVRWTNLSEEDRVIFIGAAVAIIVTIAAAILNLLPVK
jgi:hypothetical protein